MSAPTLAPVTSDDAAPARTAPFLSRAIRVTGYGRVGLGALAVGDHAGVRARLVLPIERVVAADLRLRLGGSRLAVTVTGAGEHTAAAEAAAQAAAGACHVEAGEVHLDVRLPMRRSTGTDQAEATAVAVVDALARGTETSLTPSVRAALVAAARGGSASGLAAAGPAVTGPDGAVLSAPVDLPRLLLVLAQPEGGGADAAAATEPAGTLAAAPARPDEAALASWLLGCAGGGSSEAAVAVAALAQGAPGVFGVIGGHGPLAPVAVLLDPAALRTAQQLVHRMAPVLPAGWRPSVTRTAAG